MHLQPLNRAALVLFSTDRDPQADLALCSPSTVCRHARKTFNVDQISSLLEGACCNAQRRTLLTWWITSAQSSGSFDSVSCPRMMRLSMACIGRNNASVCCITFWVSLQNSTAHYQLAADLLILLASCTQQQHQVAMMFFQPC